MANISFVLRETFKSGASEEVKRRKKEGKRIDNLFNTEETVVLLFFSYDRDHRFKCKTDLKILPKQWDFSKQRMKPSFAGSVDFNNRMDNLRNSLTEYYNTLLHKNPEITFNQLKEKISTYVKTDQSPDFEEGTGFFDVLDQYIEISKSKVSPRTIQKYNTLKKSLKTFISERKKYQHLTFSQIDLNFYDEYKNYLLLEVKNPKTGKKGLLDDTVAKYIENLKNFMKWSLDRNFHNNREFQKRDFSSSRKPKQEIVTLDFSELKQLYEYDFSEVKRLEQVRDLFCFATFTGQRWADIEKFNKDQIVDDAWVFDAQKTGKETVVPFLGYIEPALNILKKYNYELPEISNQKFNEYIKEAAEEAELKRIVKIERQQGSKKIFIQQPLYKFITMHTGRRTAVSLLLNVAKMPIPQVMEITQHTSYDTLKKYINDDKDALRNNLRQTRSVVDVELKVVKRAQ